MFSDARGKPPCSHFAQANDKSSSTTTQAFGVVDVGRRYREQHISRTTHPPATMTKVHCIVMHDVSRPQHPSTRGARTQSCRIVVVDDTFLAQMFHCRIGGTNQHAGQAVCQNPVDLFRHGPLVRTQSRFNMHQRHFFCRCRPRSSKGRIGVPKDQNPLRLVDWMACRMPYIMSPSLNSREED